MSPPEPVLRRAAPADAPPVAALVDAAYRHYVDRIGRPPRPMLADHGLAIDTDEVWVAEVDGRLVGVLQCRLLTDHLWVENVAVLPGHQGGGLGRRMLDHAEQRARAAGLPEIRLETNTRFVENRAIYAHLGYREVAERPTETTPLVELRKPLR